MSLQFLIELLPLPLGVRVLHLRVHQYSVQIKGIIIHMGLINGGTTIGGIIRIEMEEVTMGRTITLIKI